jgi:hypothetical protein
MTIRTTLNPALFRPEQEAVHIKTSEASRRTTNPLRENNFIFIKYPVSIFRNACTG